MLVTDDEKPARTEWAEREELCRGAGEAMTDVVRALKQRHPGGRGAL